MEGVFKARTCASGGSPAPWKCGRGRPSTAWAPTAGTWNSAWSGFLARCRSPVSPKRFLLGVLIEKGTLPD